MENMYSVPSHLTEEVTEMDTLEKKEESLEEVDGLPPPAEFQKLPPRMQAVYLALISILLIGLTTGAIVNLSREDPPVKEVWISILASIVTFIAPSPLSFVDLNKEVKT